MIPASFAFHILLLDANHLDSLFPIISKTRQKRSVRIRDKSLKNRKKAVKHKISQLFMVDMGGPNKNLWCFAGGIVAITFL